MSTTETTEPQSPLSATIDRYGKLISELREIVENILAKRLEPILAPKGEAVQKDEAVSQNRSDVTNVIRGKNDQFAEIIAELQSLIERIEV